MITFDLTITLGTIIETAVLGGGGVAALVTLRNTVASLKADAKQSKQDIKDQFTGIQNELRKMGEILIEMARFDEKLSSLDARVTTHGRKIDELSRGVGFVQQRQRPSVDGEY